MGWRYWYLAGGPSPLRSTSQHGVVWRPGQALRAVCRADSHPAPDRRCACGVYGTADLAALRSHALCLRPGPLVVGGVALWGPIVADEEGFRAAFGYPRRLWLVVGTVPEKGSEAALASLAAYGVPVGRMPLVEAVGEVSTTIMGFLARSGPEPPAGWG